MVVMMGLPEDDAYELMMEEKEEPMYIWIGENRGMLESEFLEQLPPEDQPLDDDIPAYMSTNCDDFDEYCRKRYDEDGE